MQASPAIPPSAAPQAFMGWEQRVCRISACRVCGNRQLMPVVDLGAQCLASLFDDGQPHNQLETPVPLAVVRCDPAGATGACGFVQLTHTVPPDVLYHDYGYRSGINTTMRRHLEALTQELESRASLAAGDIVVDIGANDGTTLLAYRTPNLARVGFEPSNIRPDDPDHGLVYLPTIFQAAGFHERFPDRKARAVSSIAMFYDLDDPVAFCRQIHEILADDGLWVLEMSYLGSMLDLNSFDAICHEHLGYYSLTALQQVTQRAGFVFDDILFNQSNGGSIRCYLRKAGAGISAAPAAHQQRVEQALLDERAKGYLEPPAYERFRRHVEEIGRSLREHLEGLQKSARRVYGYGASTKGNVLLQYAGLGPQQLVAIADRNPAKVGRRTLGTKIPICSEEDMRRAQPQDLLILPWHFLEEFVQREQVLRSAGTRFIVPFPRVHIV